MDYRTVCGKEWFDMNKAFLVVIILASIFGGLVGCGSIASVAPTKAEELAELKASLEVAVASDNPEDIINLAEKELTDEAIEQLDSSTRRTLHIYCLAGEIALAVNEASKHLGIRGEVESSTNYTLESEPNSKEFFTIPQSICDRVSK